MKEEVPRLDLAPKLRRPLQLWNPMDYLRLLYWVFYFPQALRWYAETFASEHKSDEIRALLRSIIQDDVLRNIILQASILCLVTPVVVVLFIAKVGLPIDWSRMAIDMAVYTILSMLIGITIGIRKGTSIAVIFGAAVWIAFCMPVSVAGGIVEGVALGATEGVIISMVLGVGFGLVGYSINSISNREFFDVFPSIMVVSVSLGTFYGFSHGVTEGVASALVFAATTLRPDNWAIAAFFSFSSHANYLKLCTSLPLLNLKPRLKDWLKHDWRKGVYNLNQLQAYSMQFTPVVHALNESLAEYPPEQIIPLVDEVAKDPYNWNLLRYASAPLATGLRGLWKTQFPADLRLDTPAHAASAGFWYLHKRQPLEATQAFAVVRSLPNGEEIYYISQALHLAQLIVDFQSLADLAGQDDFQRATTKPSEPLILHPQTWQALEHLRRCSLEAHAVRDSASKATRSWALNRAIGEVVAVQKMIDTIPQAERALIEEIAKNWQSILVSESSEVGSIIISEPVKNPYVAGDPVVGPGFKGREDILRELKQLWSGTTKPPSVVLYGHRRMGKTSILRNINSHLGSEVRLAYVNLLILGGAERGLSDLFLAIADEIRASLPELPQADMDEFDRHPELAFKQYLDLVQSALSKSRLIIALDEFEKLEEWMNAGQIPGDILDTFRGYIQKDQNIAFAFAGLHKLEEMTADYFNPLFASVRPIPVSFLSKDATFQVLANPPLEDFPLDFSREALERIWELTGGQPYLVQLVGHYLVSRFNRLTFEQGKQLEPIFSLEDVEAVIADPEFYSQGRYYFAGIWGQAGQGAEGQQELLKFIAAFPDGISIEGIAARFGLNSEKTIAVLEELKRHDVLRQKDEQWQFTVELMRRWVKEYSDELQTIRGRDRDSNPARGIHSPSG